MKGLLTTANQAFQKCQTTVAMAGYVESLLKMPELGNSIAANISRTRQQYLNSRNHSETLKVVVCGWELAHNAAGRAHTLAEIYREITSDVEIVGSIFSHWGREVWEPIRETPIPIHAFVVESDHFIEQALTLVAAHPADVVHLSKPRAPNIFFGIFYKLLWGSRVIVDIDDEELAFVKAETPLTVSGYLQEYPTLPPIDQLTDTHWTRIAVGLVNEFDAITVSNSALQRRYGGLVIGHARDPRMFVSSAELRKTSRQTLGIQTHQKVVLFSGTPRPHKGLFEVAQAIQALQREDVVFVIAGSFADKDLKLKAKLQTLKGVNYLFFENQPVEVLARIIAIADCCVLLQDTTNPICLHQIPAKLSDALAMRIPVIVSATPALSDVIAAAAVLPATKENLAQRLLAILTNHESAQVANGHRYFIENLSIGVNKRRLEQLLNSAENKSLSVAQHQLLDSFLEYH